MQLPGYPLISLLACIALIPWYIFISDASQRSKLIVGGLFIAALLCRFQLHLSLLSVLLEVATTIYVLIYIRLQA